MAATASTLKEVIRKVDVGIVLIEMNGMKKCLLTTQKNPMCLFYIADLNKLDKGLYFVVL